MYQVRCLFKFYKVNFVLGLWFVLIFQTASLYGDTQSVVVEQRSALAVETAKIKKGTVRELVFADGNVASTRREFLSFESSARVAFLKTNNSGGPLREGDSVVRGELLAELDRKLDDASIRVARAELDTARAALVNAGTEFERAKRLKSSAVIQVSQYEAVETAYKQALAAVRAAEARADQATAGLRQLQIRAPFDGVVAFVNIREGQYFSSQQTETGSARLATLNTPIVVIDPRSFEIILELPVTEGRKVRADQPAYLLDAVSLARVQSEGFNVEKGEDDIRDLMLPARVGSVSPAVDPGSRSIRARVVTDEFVDGLTDGAYVTVWIEVARRDQVVVIPMEAIVLRGDIAYAFIVDEHKSTVEKRKLELGITGNEGVEVISGLQAGDRIVTKGRYRLTSGMRVRYAQAN